MDSKTSPVTIYAERVLNGDIIAGKLVKAACQRHVDDLEQGHKRGLTFDTWTAQKHIDFTSYMRQSKGEKAGQPLNLAPWQQFRIGSVFGWKRQDGTRRFRVAYNEVARKNGKSTEAAGVALDGLIADGEPGAEVYSAATKLDQAALVFNEARRMVRKSPALQKRVKSFKKRLSIDMTDSIFEPLSSDSRTLDGLNPHLIVIDELHKHNSRDLLDVLETATGARRQPLLWIITTAGDDRVGTVYADERAYAEKIVLRTLENDSYFAYIATLDDDDEWDDPNVWIKANPNLGVSVRFSDLSDACTSAQGNPAKQAAFRRLRCNQRMSDTVAGIDAELWKKNTLGPVDIDTMHGRAAFAAFDISSKQDLTAAALLFPPVEDGERWKLHVKLWCPGENVKGRADRDRASYPKWIEDGWIEATPGNVVDQDSIKKELLEWHRKFAIQLCPYDPWDATKLSTELQDAGMTVREFIQGLRSYSHPSKEFLNLIKDCKLDHGGNPVLTWMASNIMFQQDKNLNLMPHKQKSTGRIDGLTAAIMAYGAALSPEDTGPYTPTRGLIII